MENKTFSYGHSVRAISEFLKTLKEKDIDILVDVRSRPQSRFQPQYNQKALADSLLSVGILYVFKGKNLGGKDENVDYEETIDELVEIIKTGKRVCVMCSEGDYKKCHRHQVLEPSLNQRGVSMEHI